MEIKAEIVANSRAYKVRMVTYKVTAPRFILAEVNTHRDLSRNSASSRAIPIEKRLASIRKDPFVPLAFAANKRGMQAGELLDERDNSKAQDAWLRLKDAACDGVEALLDTGIHKQWGNRPLEPYAWHTMILTATEWENFFNLRTHHAAQPEFIELATQMRELYHSSTPRELTAGDWHLPFIDESWYPTNPEDAALMWGTSDLVKISSGVCAAVSYERQVEEREGEEWIALHDRLRSVGHMSPFEHQAQVVAPIVDYFSDYAWWAPPFSPVYRLREDAVEDSLGAWQLPDGSSNAWEVDHYRCGNIRAPFFQYRKMLAGEAVWVPQ